jgi:phosphatidylglycerophosphatase A
MAEEYSSETCRRLAAIADGQDIVRPRRVRRHEAGETLELDLTGVAPPWRARGRFELEKYVGGGFAGQVYRARLTALEGAAAADVQLEIGRQYALKMFVPWSGFARRFRNALYAVAFQAPFGLRGNEDAVRAASLWQKLLRRGAAVRLGDEEAVRDIHATFCDGQLGAMGQLLEWVDGRPWRLEVNDRLLVESEAPGGTEQRVEAHTAQPPGPDSEYAAKKRFMQEVVELFHEMGAPELARQYEWWTMKSQPNVLKRNAAGEDPSAGLVAVDFGAGLALLPFLPMSPGDVKLIVAGVAGGRVVQFDRGDLDRLHAFIRSHSHAFEGLGGAIAELERVERDYHESQADFAHHGLRLMTDHRLHRSATEGWVRSYETRGMLDASSAARFRRRPMGLLAFLAAGLMPLLGRLVQRLWGSAVYRRHAARALGSWDYLKRTLRAKQAEMLIHWVRRGRAGDARAEALMRHPVAFWAQAVLLGWLPGKAFRIATDRSYAWDVVRYVVARPVKLFFDRAYREEWLLGMIEEGRQEEVLTDEEAEEIRGHLKEPYIQTYLLSMVVHLLTIPVTQVVSVILGWYFADKYGGSAVESGAIFGGIVAAFQFTPISPGSITRGLYATGLMLWKRDWRNYSWAVMISYWKYIGYLGFPIQMVKSYPTLSRFVATRWAIHATNIVPVFGERGALLEYVAFNAFFNGPISLRRKLQRERAARPPLGKPPVLAGSLLGLGYVPGPTGTYGSVVTAGLACLAYYLGCPLWAALAGAAVLTLGAIALGNSCARLSRRGDPGWFILDEVAGMAIAALALWHAISPAGWITALVSLFWFRVCDVVKPPPVRQAEGLPGGWGIAADDVLAGALALALTIVSLLGYTHLAG